MSIGPASACYLYLGPPSTVWPTQAFPASQYRNKFSGSDLREARQAWALFEQVESQDASTRVRLSGTGWTPPRNPVQDPSLWYVFADQPEYLRYKRGRYLHIQLCPTFSWVSQRNLGISPDPVTDVMPPVCF